MTDARHLIGHPIGGGYVHLPPVRKLEPKHQVPEPRRYGIDAWRQTTAAGYGNHVLSNGCREVPRSDHITGTNDQGAR